MGHAAAFPRAFHGTGRPDRRPVDLSCTRAAQVDEPPITRLGCGHHVLVSRPPILDVPLAQEPIRLGQFLKLAGLAEHGAHAKELLEAGEVQVNGRVETRRGTQLRSGDVVAVHGRRVRPVGP
jgi:ribosome-associated protein